MEKKKKISDYGSQSAGLPDPPPASFTVPPPAIREQLARIVASSGFAAAERLTRFLTFAVEETINGRGGNIKEYLLGLEVFDRTESFDPRTDPVVRVEAHRLRAKLKEYYENGGRDDPVYIEFPKGSYLPAFSLRNVERKASEEKGVQAGSASRLKSFRILVVVLASVTVAALALVISYRSGRDGIMANNVTDSEVQPDLSSIAVLPFVDLSPEKDLEYFCHGVAEEIISALTSVSGLRVVSRSSAFQFSPTGDDVSEIGERLNVGAVLKGSVRRSGNNLRITAQLINARDGYYLWSKSYDSDLSNVLVIQDQISESVMSALKMQFTRASTAVRKSTHDLHAYNLYLKGRYFQNKRSAPGLLKSIECFEEAIRLDPDFSLAWAGQADSNALLASGGFTSPIEAMPKAKAAALKALRLDEQLGEAHASLAFTKSYYDWDWEGALSEYRRAIELNPGYATAHHWHAGCLRAMGLLERAEKANRRAQELDPLSPAITRDLGRIFRWEGHYDSAIGEFHKTLELDPGFSSGYLNLGLTYQDKGMPGDAVAALEKARELDKDDPEILGVLGYCYARLGDRRRAEELFQDLQKLSTRRYVSPTSAALVWVGLGEKDRAFEWLDEAYKTKDPLLSWLKIDSVFEPLRSDRRYFVLLKNINLEAGDYE
ncbi:MAG: tetratricopeptide repeat protein [Acidobacteriota bacterium]